MSDIRRCCTHIKSNYNVDVTRQSNRGDDGRATNPSGSLIVKVSTTRPHRERSIGIGLAHNEPRVIKLPFYIRFTSLAGAARAARRHVRSPSSFPLHTLCYTSPVHLFFSNSSISSRPRCGLFSPPGPASPPRCPLASSRPAVANSPRCAARGQQRVSVNLRPSRANIRDSIIPTTKFARIKCRKAENQSGVRSV